MIEEAGTKKVWGSWPVISVLGPYPQASGAFQTLQVGEHRVTYCPLSSLQYSLLLCIQNCSLKPFCILSVFYLLLIPSKVLSFKILLLSLLSWDSKYSHFVFMSTKNITGVCNQPLISTHTHHTHPPFTCKCLFHANCFKKSMDC